MKKIFAVTILILFIWPHLVQATETDLAQQLSGRILLQVESYGRAWYVDPIGKERYYLQDGNMAYEIMRNMSLGITNADLAKIPTARGQKANSKLVNRLLGRILLQVEKNGEAWYVNPTDGIRYYLKDGQAAYELMRKFALGITNENLAKIPMNKTQVAHDTCFNDVAYVKFDGTDFSDEYNADQILPLASLSKLMTALVLIDLKPNWDKQIIITQDQIDYPILYVGSDKSSEVDLAAGDKMTFYDLWVAMLVASSNQAAAALVDSTGLSKMEFLKLMNNKAQELELTKTKFYDVAGLDAHNITTPKEMAKIAYQAFSIAKITEAGENENYTIAATTSNGTAKAIDVLDRNYSLQKFEPQASKTGFLVEAQRTVALKKNDQIIVIMHALSMSQRNSIIEKLLD
ncbi:MAG: serine hydrolase [Patescibacteria group bacterium]|jgi:hypothetical protein